MLMGVELKIEDFIAIFQNFYQLTGRLPLSNELLVVPVGDAPPGEDRVNMKNLYEMFRYKKSHGLVSLPFLGVIQYYLEINDFSLIKMPLLNFISNLSYITLSDARDLSFDALADLTGKISFLLKKETIQNIRESEESHARNAYNINRGRLFQPKTEDPLDTFIDILDDPTVEHKKGMFPYVPPQVQTADEIETEVAAVDDDFTRTKAKYDQINDAATEQKKQNIITDLIDDIIDETNPYQNLGTEDIWIEDDMFDQKGEKDISDFSNEILKKINESDSFIDFSEPTETIIDDIFNDDDLTDNENDNKVTIEDVTDDENETLPSDVESITDAEEIIAIPAVIDWDPKNTAVSANTRPRRYSQYNTAVRTANKIKNKYRKKL